MSDHLEASRLALVERSSRRLEDLLATWQQPGVSPATPATSTEAWMAAASGRPAWQCWGKGRPQGDCPAHPALCHMLDVAAVAAHLLVRLVPPALRTRLLSVHPDGPEAALRLVLFTIALHDLGKFTPAFQAKLPWAAQQLAALGFDLNATSTAQHHGDAGGPLVRDTLRRLGLSAKAATSLSRAVVSHHGEFSPDTAINKNVGSRERGRAPRWDQARRDAVEELRALFAVTQVETLHIDNAWVMTLAGLAAVADWIGSMEEVFTYEAPQPSLAHYWPIALERAERALRGVGMAAPQADGLCTFATLFPALRPWPLHIVADTLASTLTAPSLLVVEAPMGEGKTEASLLLAQAAAMRLGQQGLYIGLPTKATANQMFGRVLKFLQRIRPDTPSNLVLAHGDADLDARFVSLRAIYDPHATRASGVRAEGWFLPKKRALLAEHAVGTIDQSLLAVMRTLHGFVRLFGLAGKTVILDEVHAYDTYTSTLLDRLVEWLGALGTTVVLLSATLPSARRQQLVRAYQQGCGIAEPEALAPTAYPRVTLVSGASAESTHFTPRGQPVPVSLARAHGDLETIADDIVQRTEHGGCAGWICNTVDRAQAAYKAIRQRLPAEVPVLLLHARMLPEERAAREQTLEQWLGPEQSSPNRPARCVVVGTQVLEQSLDVDFDLLVTDLAPVDLVLQRAGRLHRHTDRRNRSAAHPTPRLILVHPDGDFAHVDLREVAIVYAEALVRETLRALHGRTTITLPDDIEPLVEAVYRTDLPVADDALFGAHIEHLGIGAAKSQDAAARLIPRPSQPGDIFGDLKVWLDDEENPALHEKLRAMTRDADDSVQVVCHVGRGNAVFVSEQDSTPLDLASKPDRQLAARLARRTVNIGNAFLVRALLGGASVSPEGWQEVALLRHRRALVFVDGTAQVGDRRLTLDAQLGLVIERPSARSTS